MVVNALWRVIITIWWSVGNYTWHVTGLCIWTRFFWSVLFLYIYCARIFSELFFSPIFKNWNQKAIEWILRGAGRNEKSKLVLITVKLQSILIFFNIKTQKGLFKKVLLLMLLMFLVHVIITTNQSLSNLLI